MGDQMIALRGPRGERPAVESDVVAKRVGPGADRVGGAGRGGVAVDADVAKVLTECRLHAGANRPGEGFAAALHSADAGLGVGGNLHAGLPVCSLAPDPAGPGRQSLVVGTR